MTRRNPLAAAYAACAKNKLQVVRTVINPDGTATIHHVDADSGQTEATRLDGIIADFVTGKGGKRGKDHRAN